ncbi:hypothetical protein I552_10183 [Mycobacterium xenopi 3993]|nr:hypothetical protein I552_10183 [Mycobacterium xenopi 3993]
MTGRSRWPFGDKRRSWDDRRVAVSHQPPPSGEPGGSSWPQVLAG